ncbi:MAG: hypothetical protein R2838_16270 [Caldilineaceae bacterium]
MTRRASSITPQPQQITRDGDYYVLSLALPLVEREEVKLHRSVFDELIIRIGNWKRNVSLPLGLAKLDIAGAVRGRAAQHSLRRRRGRGSHPCGGTKRAVTLAHLA